MRPKRQKHKELEPREPQLQDLQKAAEPHDAQERHEALQANSAKAAFRTRKHAKARKSGQSGFRWGRPGQNAGRSFSRQVDADLTEAEALENHNSQHADSHPEITGPEVTSPEFTDTEFTDTEFTDTEFNGADFPEISSSASMAAKSRAKSKQPAPITLAVVRERAVRLLVNREHGRLELEQKLQQRELPQDLIVSVLDQLAEEGLQCDARFAESYTRMRVDRGYGANKVRADLQTRRLDQGVIEDAIRDSGVDWYGLAAATLVKKFGNHPAADVKTRAKMQRYLYQRGFSMDEIRSAIED